MTLAAILASIEAGRTQFSGPPPKPLSGSSRYRAGYDHAIDDVRRILTELDTHDMEADLASQKMKRENP